MKKYGSSQELIPKMLENVWKKPSKNFLTIFENLTTNVTTTIKPSLKRTQFKPLSKTNQLKQSSEDTINDIITTNESKLNIKPVQNNTKSNKIKYDSKIINLSVLETESKTVLLNTNNQSNFKPETDSETNFSNSKINSQNIINSINSNEFDKNLKNLFLKNNIQEEINFSRIAKNIRKNLKLYKKYSYDNQNSKMTPNFVNRLMSLKKKNIIQNLKQTMQRIKRKITGLLIK